MENSVDTARVIAIVQLLSGDPAAIEVVHKMAILLIKRPVLAESQRDT